MLWIVTAARDRQPSRPGASFRVRGPGWLIAEYGSHLKGYAAAGRRIVVVTDVRNDSPADARTSASIETWASGFVGRPLDLLEGPEGDVLVTDFFQGTVLRFFKSTREREQVLPSKAAE